jgi:hypothetical protein
MSVGSLATVGALLISLFLLRQQLRDQRQARQEKRRDHASHISFWLTVHDYTRDPVTLEDGPYSPQIEIDAHIANTSQRPVMSVLVLAGIRRDVWRDAAAKDKTAVSESTAQFSKVAIAPDDTQLIRIFIQVPASVVHIIADRGNTTLIGELYFTDAAGVDWVRTHTGELIERRSAQWRAGIPLSISERDEVRRNPPAAVKVRRAGRWARKLGDKLVSFAEART